MFGHQGIERLEDLAVERIVRTWTIDGQAAYRAPSLPQNHLIGISHVHFP